MKLARNKAVEMTAWMGSEENKKPFPSLPHSPWKSRKERGITTFPPHGDYY